MDGKTLTPRNILARAIYLISTGDRERCLTTSGGKGIEQSLAKDFYYPHEALRIISSASSPPI